MDHHDQQKASILTVDDNINDLNLLTNILIDHPYKLRRAISPSLALGSIEASLPDLVLLDINMPEMSGYEFCQRIKTNPKTQHIPVIFISASDVGLDKEMAFRCGGSDYISKPYQMEEVIVRIENQIKLQQSYQALKRQKSKLEMTLLALRRTQHSLLESERQATLGRIVNRIARDIAQPMGRIHTNIGHIHRQSKDMQSMLALHRSRGKQPIIAGDLDYIIDDLGNIEKLSDSIQHLSSQLQESIYSLQMLFQEDQVTQQEINLHHTLDTLIAALGRLWQSSDNPSVNIERQYGEIGMLHGPASSLNQAIFLILNLLAELTLPADFISSETADDVSLILETVQKDSSNVYLSFYHGSIDLASSLNQQIKDPFSAIGATSHSQIGQSLCVIRQVIIDKWKGDLFCQSYSQGMKIILKLPNYQY